MVTTAGSLRRTVSRPPSTSRVTTRAAVVDRELGSERALRPAEQRREHLAGLIAVVVDGLLAEDDEVGLLGLDDALEDLGDSERLDGRVGRLDEDAAVGADGERGADGLLRLRRADGNDDDLGAAALLLDADCLFDGDLVRRGSSTSSRWRDRCPSRPA